jgi:pyruvate/2-oxoglutarate dehydrogenase complex dihydrolipoamide acyltransferase (E2) component
MEGRFVRTSEELTKKEQSQYKKLKQDELNSLESMMSGLGINNNNRKEIKKKLHELGSINDALFYYIQKHYIEERMNPKYAKQFIKKVDDIFSEFELEYTVYDELEKQKKTYVMDGFTNDNDLVENLLSLLGNYRKQEQKQKSSSRQKQKSSSQQKTQQDQDEDIGKINPGSNIFVNLSSGTTRGEIITRERVKKMKEQQKEQQRKAQEQKARVRQKGKQGKQQKGKQLEPQKGKQQKGKRLEPQKGKQREQFSQEQYQYQYQSQKQSQYQYQYQSQEYDWDC